LSPPPTPTPYPHIPLANTGKVLFRVVDPYSFFTDPDPELDGGGQYGSGSNTDPGL